MSIDDILEELDQVEASNNIEVDDLETKANASHTRRKRAKNDGMTLVNVMTRTCNALVLLTSTNKRKGKIEWLVNWRNFLFLVS